MARSMSAWEQIRWQWGLAWRVVFDALVIAAAGRAAPARDAPACIVRLDGIGDFVLWLDACRRLAAHCRATGARVVLVANALWGGWARELGLADEVWDFERARFAQDLGYRAGWLRRMRAAGFSVVLQPAHSRRPAEGDALVRASGAPERIGSAGDATNAPAWLKRWSDRWYSKLIACGGDKRMELLRNADFMRGLGIADYRARAPEIGAVLPRNPAGLAPKSYAVLVPGAGSDMRAWPIARFADTGRRLAAAGLRVVVAGGAADAPAAQALQEELPGQVEDLTGRTSLGELASLMAGARVVIANETGAAHVAAAAGAPVVCVMGGGHYGRFLPYQVEQGGRAVTLHPVSRNMDCFGCNWNCIYARAPGEPVKCVRDIGADQLWAQVAACLEPETPGAHFHLGLALQGAGRYDEAHGAFREALRLRLRGEAAPEGPRVPVPRTTLVCVDCRHHELALVALRRSMAQCRFERVQWFTNRPLEAPGIDVVVIPDIASIADYSRFMIKDLANHVATDFALVVQYDGFVVNGRRWRAEFLDYDYLGAPWPDGGVGNGGFSLRSTKLMRALQDPRVADLVPEDIAICRTYRGLLESEYGIRIAPAEVAARFSFETRPPPEPTLGFHGIAHMVRIIDMSEAELERYRPEPMVTYEKG
jgi:ADP-heptose:LPS heptosyltransferase